jgi:site-specific DNA-methyltransferase (adenine-specific)
MARKPLAGTVAANVLEHGTGALNVDGCRVSTDEQLARLNQTSPFGNSRTFSGGAAGARLEDNSQGGRWPANLIHDGSDEVVGLFPEANSARIGNPNNPHRGINHTATSYGQGDGKVTHDFRDNGSAARFFYTAKCSKSERGKGNNHPTVKPIALMRYLCRLVTPPGGIVLDPFMGSGTTGKAALLEGFSFIGIERDPKYFEIAQARVNNEPIPADDDDDDKPAHGRQASLFDLLGN